MPERVDLYGAYGHFGDRVLAAVRAETFGTDIGQNSWVTADEYDRFASWLGLAAGHHVLEVASGRNPPAPRRRENSAVFGARMSFYFGSCPKRASSKFPTFAHTISRIASVLPNSAHEASFTSAI